MGRVGRVPARLGVLTILLFLSSLACQKDPESNDTAELIARAAQFNADSSRLAHDGDYRGAIVKAKAALIIWEKIPRSEELQANQRKVIQALEESSDAASFIDEVERLETEFQKHFDAGEYEKSIEYLQQQLAVLQKLPDTEALQIAQRERMRITEARIEKEEESNGIVDEALRDLMSTNPQNRLSAISFLAGAAEMELLGHYGSKVESILSRISREDTDQLLRAAAYEALQKFPGRSVESNTTPTESAQGQAITFLTGTKDFRSALAGFSEVQDPTNDPRKWSALLATASSEKRRCEESLGLDVRECAQFRALCLALDALDLVGFVVDKRESIGMEVATRKVEFGRNAANTLLADVEAYEAALSDLSERMLNDTVTAYKFMIERERSQIDELLGQTAPTSASRVVSQEDIDRGVDLMRSGVTLRGNGDMVAAILALGQALENFSGNDGARGERAECNLYLGLVYIEVGFSSLGIACLKEALTILETIEGTFLEQCLVYSSIGSALQIQGGYEEAIQYQSRALQMYKSCDDSDQFFAREGIAQCYLEIGRTLCDIGKWEEAIAHEEQALHTFQQIANSRKVFEQSSEGSNLLTKVEGYFEAATIGMVNCHISISIALQQQGEFDKAIRHDEEALEILRDHNGTGSMEATCYGSMGVAYYHMGKYEASMAGHSRALAIYRESRCGPTEILNGLNTCYGNIGNVLRSTGLLSEAIDVYESVGGSSWWISRGLGLAYAQRDDPGDTEKAMVYFLESIRLIEQQRLSVLASDHRVAIFVEPSEVFRDVVAFIVRPSNEVERPDPEQISAAFKYAEQGKGRALEDALREKSTLQSTRADGKLLGEDRELSLRVSKLSSLREPLPEDGEERAKLSEEIDTLQQRRNMIEVELKKTALGDYVAPEFRAPMELAEELEPDRAVLQYSVGEKEGWLLVLTREGVTAHKLGADIPALPELLPRQEATLPQLAEAWTNRPSSIGIDGLVRLARARAEDSGRRASERESVVDAALEKAVLERLAAVVLPDTALSALQTKGIRRLLIVPDGSLHYIPFAMLRLKIADEADSHYLVEEFSSSYVPAMTTLDTIRKQSVERASKRAIERRALLAFANPAYGSGPAPPTARATDDMITRLRSFRDEYYRGGGLRLTSLPETEREAVRIASLFAPPQELREPITNSPDGRAVVLTGEAASEETAKLLLSAPGGTTAKKRLTPRWKYLVFSTHGLADTYNGMLSCLALSSPAPESGEDGFLQAQEVMSLELDTDVVMLSACQTGLGRLRGGEGLVGLSAAFFYAGAESVCASLWQVPSGPTTQLVPEFFKHLEGNDADRAEALRQAQLVVLREGRDSNGKSADYTSPFCWAAFVLMGEYR